MTPEEIAAIQKKNEELEATIKANAAEAAKGGDDEARKRLAYLEDEHKTLIAARDKAKDEKRLADDAKLAEQGEFKLLAEQKQKELDAFAKQIEESNTILTGYKVRDEAKLQTLIELIPENLRETVAGNSGTLAEKIDLAEKLATVKPTAPGARPGGDTHTATLQEEYNQARKDGNVALQVALKRQLFEKKE